MKCSCIFLRLCAQWDVRGDNFFIWHDEEEKGKWSVVASTSFLGGMEYPEHKHTHVALRVIVRQICFVTKHLFQWRIRWSFPFSEEVMHKNNMSGYSCTLGSLGSLASLSLMLEESNNKRLEKLHVCNSKNNIEFFVKFFVSLFFDVFCFFSKYLCISFRQKSRRILDAFTWRQKGKEKGKKCRQKFEMGNLNNGTLDWNECRRRGKVIIFFQHKYYFFLAGESRRFLSCFLGKLRWNSRLRKKVSVAGVFRIWLLYFYYSV